MRLNQSGVTLIEVMMVSIISVIALMAATTPFVSEKSFWATGRKRAEAQRDAQMAMRSIAFVARQSNNFTAVGSQLTLTHPNGCTRVFQTAGAADDQLQLVDNCVSPSKTLTLIDGDRTEIDQFLPTSVNTRLVDIQLQVTEENQETELLNTQIFLRNAT